MKNNLKLILTIIVTALACVLVPSPASTADTGKLTVMRSATFGKKPILDVYLHRKRVGHAVNQVSINQKNLAQVPLDPFEHSPSRFFVWILRDEFAAEGFDENRRPCVALVSGMQIGSSSSPSRLVHKFDPQTRIAAIGSCSTREAKSFYRPRTTVGSNPTLSVLKKASSQRSYSYLDKIGT
jgi:hypothetical protein